MTVTLLLALALGYALGSIPFGLILTRLAGTEDIRTIGSGNIGATNVLRTGRKGLAAATLLGDALKGTVAVLLARAFLPALAGSLAGSSLDAGAGLAADLPGAAALAAAVGAFLGHIAPVWLGFKGGKGVATFLGTLIAVSWIAAIAFAVLWLATAKLSRFSSLAALIASAATPVVLLALGWREGAAVYAVLAAVLWWKHSANIGRLRAGTEGRIGAKG